MDESHINDFPPETAVRLKLGCCFYAQIVSLLQSIDTVPHKNTVTGKDSVEMQGSFLLKTSFNFTITSKNVIVKKIHIKVKKRSLWGLQKKRQGK